MKKLVRRFKEQLVIKGSPPPYRESDVRVETNRYDDARSLVALPCDALDLLANCKEGIDRLESEAEYAEIPAMGLWHSTPLAHRHKSKISLTWVLKENLETKLPTDTENRLKNLVVSDERRTNENERVRKCKSKEVRERVVGRNEYYHNLRFRSVCDELVNQESCSDETSVATEEYTRRRHRHRHRRKKKREGRFGYDIRDLDSFLSEASIDRPGNIPVVIAYPSTLYQTHKSGQTELTLPLGTVVNAVFKNQQWVYAQTPHGNEGYVLYSACLPLGILPSRPSTQKKAPCWESSTDIYPRPCGNLTDNEKEQLRGRTRSECRYKPKRKHCAEKDFDTLYLKTKSVYSDIDKISKNRDVEKVSRNYEVDKLSRNYDADKLCINYDVDKLCRNSNLDKLSKNQVQRHTLLVINSDFKGNVLNKTLTVTKGEVVVLVQGRQETDVDTEWFYVKKRDGSQGFIPAIIAGHGYI